MRFAAVKDLHVAWLLLTFAFGGMGCTAYAPKVVLDQNGLANSPTSAPSSVNLFNSHFESLYRRSLGIDQPGRAAEAKPGVEEVRQLTREGASLAYQYCSSFFKRAGTEQQYLLFSRDLIALVGTLATGVIGATRGSPAAAAGIGLGSGAALSGISVYSRNFLFSEDNVQSVQDLTLRAMAAQADASLQRSAANGSYALLDSVQDIMDIQAVCEVQKIIALVRQSIGQAQPVAVESVSGHISTNVPAQEPTAAPAPTLKVVGVGVATTASARLLQHYLASVGFPQREQRIVQIEAAAKRLGFGDVEADSFVRDSSPANLPRLDAVAKRLGLSKLNGG